jgi:hypothetical protein
MASCASRFCFRARVSIPSVALEDIAEGVVRASLCVQASEKALHESENSRKFVASVEVFFVDVDVSRLPALSPARASLPVRFEHARASRG